MLYGGGLLGQPAQSCLDTQFSKVDFTLEGLLDEDNIVNDVKMNQNKFAEYMLKNPKHLSTLVKYAISLPLETEDVLHQRKYPFIASELLGINIPKIQEFFFSQKPPISEKKQLTDLDLLQSQGVEEITQFDIQSEEKGQEEKVNNGEEESLSKEIEVIEEKEVIFDQNESEISDKEQLISQIDSKDKQVESTSPDQIDEKTLETETLQIQPVSDVQEGITSSDVTTLKAEDNTTSEEIESIVETSVETTIASTDITGTLDNKTIDQVETIVTEEKKEAQEDVNATSMIPIINDKSADEGTKSNIQELEEIKPEAEVKDIPQVIYGEDLLKDLFAFIQQTEELNSTSTGYFCKIVLQLVNPSSGKLLKYLRQNPEIIDNLLYHFYLKSISKVVMAIISQDGIEIDPDTFLEDRVALVKKLYEKIDTCTDHEVLINVQETIQQINEAPLKPHTFEIKRSLFSKEHIDILVNAIQQHKESFSQAALTLSSFVDHYREVLFNEPNDERQSRFNQSLNLNKSNEEMIVKEFPLDYLQSKMSILIKALMDENLNQEVPSHETQYGAIVQPFGLNRIKLLHLILGLLKNENVAVCDALIEGDFFPYLLNLIIKHQFNNILHSEIESIIIECFRIAIKDTRVRDSIVIKAGFVQFLANNCMTMKTQPGTSRKPINKGYISFLVNFANQMEQQRSQLEWLREALSQTPNWQDFVNGTIKELNGMHDRFLGNDHPNKHLDMEKFMSMCKGNKDENTLVKEAEKTKEGQGKESKVKEDTGDTPKNPEETEIHETIRLAKEREFEACNYWKVDLKYDIDSLAKDL